LPLPRAKQWLLLQRLLGIIIIRLLQPPLLLHAPLYSGNMLLLPTTMAAIILKQRLIYFFYYSMICFSFPPAEFCSRWMLVHARTRMLDVFYILRQ
jgi:hypothetical protein